MIRGLSFLSRGGMNRSPFNMEPQTQLTVPEGTTAKDRLEVLLYVHLGVAISKIIVLGFSFGFGDLI